MKKYERVLSIAGFDGSGGAGLQADLKTFSALNCYGMSVLTSLPIQNTQGVGTIYDITAQCVREQGEAILSDIGVDAVKIGMLHRVDIIEVVVELIRQFSIKKVVLDPVMIATSGHALINDLAIEALRKQLIPLATVITPNLPEAECLTGIKIHSAEDRLQAATLLLGLGCGAVVLKGGHSKDKEAVDLFLDRSRQPLWLSKPWVVTRNTHGTGCTFSAAIAAYLAKNIPLVTAVSLAKDYLHQALQAGAAYECGHGHGPVCHHWQASSM